MCAVPAVVTTFAKSAIGKAVIGAVIGTAAQKLLTPRPKQQAMAPAIIPKQNVPKVQTPAPMQAAALEPENIRPEDEEIETTLNKKQKAKLARKTLGVKSLAAVEPPTNAAPLGINPGSYT